MLQKVWGTKCSALKRLEQKPGVKRAPGFNY